MADKGKKIKEEDDHILYNLLVHAEWNLEGEVLNKDSLDILQQKGSLGKKLLSIVEVSLWNFWKLVKYPFRGFGNVCVLPEELIKLSESPQTWDISLSSDGNFLAVLQEQCIEIRTAKDNFSSIVSKCQVTKDASPRWRKLSWNGDGSLLAFAYSSGEVLIFDLSGTGLCSLKDSTSSNIYSGSPFSHGNAIAGLIFIKRNNSTKSFLELIIISYQGYLRSYIINGTSGEHEKKYTFSFQSVLPYGVSSAVYYPMNKLLILGSPGTYDSRATSGKSGIESGITMWRLLSDHPHFKLIEDQALELKKTQQEAGFCRKFLPARSGNKQNGVWKMSLSLDNKALLVLHFSGRLSLWELPSLKLRKSWERGDQPEYKSEEVNLHFPGLNTKKRRGDDENFLYDIGWWSSEAVVLARSSGAITVSTVKKSLQNILGQYAEWCEPLPLVTSANNGGFLILECENAIVSSSPIRKAVFDEGNKGTHEDYDDDEEHHVMTKTKELTKHVLYFLTESERFRPPVRRPKILKQTYRLLCLRSTTPEELYARKIELEEYGEALALAQSYGLDCDLVYQKQWRKSKVTVSSIHDYLSKVTKRIWVLHECLERVPENLDSAKALLKYGLHGTGVQVLIAIGKKQAEHPFIRDECDGKGDDGEERRDREDEKRLLRSIDFHNLSVEQRNICRYRLRFLKYLDRLSTYETILGGPAVAHDAFDSGFFTTFRDSNIVETTVEYARDNDWNAVDCLLTYHSKETIPHYLAVLSNFPETTNPFDYRSLLPEAGVRPGEPEVYEWEQKTWRTQDWVENPMYFKEVEGEAEADSGEFLYAENPQLRKFSNELTGNLLSQWYKYRAQEIERTSSQVDNALELVKLGKERGVKGLVSLYDELLTLSVAVYECQGDGHVDLESLQKLTNLEQMKLLVSKFSEQTFIKDFKKWIIPFLDRAEKRSRGNKLKLIQQFMVDSAKIDLTYPLKILEQSSSEVNEPIIPDVAQQMKLAIDCIYLCSRDDQFDKANLILKCFSSEMESILSEQIRELSGKIKEVEVHLQGAKILLANGFAKPVSYLLDTKADKKAAQSLMQTLSKIAKNREPPLKKAEWDKFLADLLKLRDKIFNCIPRTVCYQACAECLLGSGNKENIKHAEQLLCCRPGISQKDDEVDYTKSVEMVVSAAREYFNAANDVNDPCMKLAKACLELVPLSEPTVKEELNFISALSLLAEFNVSILPLQVRLCQDKAELIAKSLDSCPSAYKDPPQLLHLAALLQLSGSDEKTRRGRVLSMVAEKALQCSDITVAYDACAELMKSSYIPGWKVCRTLGEHTEFINLKARRKLLDFSLTHCDPSAVESLMRSRSLLQTEILYGKISDLMAKVGDPVNLDELSTTEHISKTTKAIISNVSDVSWWKNTLHWVRPLNRGSLERKGDEEMSVKEEATLEYRCHPFYDTVHSKQQLNQRDIHEHSGKSDETLVRVSELLLQTQKLAEERAEGSIEEPATEVLLQLASACLKKDSSLSLAYLLALPEFTNAYECFEKLPSCALTLQFASYYYALQIYNETNPQVQEHQSSLYFHPPDHVIEHVIRCSRACPEIYDDVKFLLVHLKRYHTQLSDFSQAKLLQKLGRGVDIGRFTQDEEYKRETILGLTMSVEEDIFNTAISLAQRYDISKWEMIMSHLEWLFTDSELSTKQLQDRVNEKQMMETLLEQPENVVSRLKEYIYPAIDGKQLARLLYYYMLHSDCIQRGGISSAGESDPQMHIRLIKKIKAASQGVDYKNLLDGNNPLEALRPHLISTNVHVFAKMANKLRYKDGAVLTPSHVFKVFGEKTFWEGEGKVIAKEVDWIHRYEVVHGYLERLNCQDLIDLIDSFTFSEKAIDTLSVDIRDDIVRRALKFSRQKIGKQRKKSKGDIFEGSVEISDVVAHFEQSLKHLASLDNDIIARLEESELNQHRDYARLYDLSRSEPQRIKDLCVQVLCNGDSLEMVKDILNLANQQCTQCIKTRDILKEALRIILNLYSHPDERPSYLPKDERPSVLLKRLLATLPQTESPTRKLVKDEHILEVIRAFCADETVPAGVKPEVLHLLESFLHLTGEDRMLLLYHQTNAIVHNNWDIALNIEDVQSTEKRHRLFVQIFTSSKNNKQMLSVASLLNIWPPLEGRHEGERAWYLVLLKLIQDFEDGVSVVNLVKEQNCITHLDKRDRQRLLDVLFERSSHLLAFKFGLLVGDEEMFQFVVNQMKDLQPDGSTCDNEFLELIFKNKLSANIVNTQFFSVYVNYMLQEDACGDSSRESRVNRVVHELQDVGHTIEAASIRASLEYLHPGLRTLDTAIGALFRWMGKS